jgi:Mrp family chromosome partitioning ATPase
VKSQGPSGMEELNAALRRSIWLILALVVVGVVAMNLFKQLSGPEYQATSRVLLSTTDLAGSLAGIQPVYVDPQRKDAAEQNLADSASLFFFAAQQTGGSLGTGQELRAMTTVSVANNVVEFAVVSDKSRHATAVANAVADAYPPWRATVSGRAVDAAIAQLRAQIQRDGSTPTLQSQLQRLLLLKSLNSGDTLFVEHAGPATKTTPRPVRDSLLGGVIGLIVALLIVGALELFNTSVRSENDVEETLGAPVLATVHSLPRSLRSAVLAGSTARHADEYELLAANIAQTFEDRSGATVYLAVTSAISGEGKTTTAVNLAAALARRGARVVLADFDLRKPSIDKFFAIPHDAPGMQEVLSGAAEINSVLWAVSLNGDGRSRPTGLPTPLSRSTRTPMPGGEHGALAVLPGGKVRSGRTATVGFSRLPELLSDLRQDSDFVIIDTPPALLVAGMAELAQRVDGALVVVRQRSVSRRRLRTLARQARSWRAPVLGAVFNDVAPEDGYGYGGYYGST